jgi:hypothetical protein
MEGILVRVEPDYWCAAMDETSNDGVSARIKRDTENEDWSLGHV